MSLLSLSTALAPAAAAAAEDIRDVRGALHITPWWQWPLVVLLAALAATAVVLLVRRWRQRRRRPLTPLEHALQALLVAETHAREGRSREWADVVSDTVRGALAHRLGAGVLPKTTSELATALRDLPLAPRALALLDVCDLARFAMASLDAKALGNQTTLARELVERLFAPEPKPKNATETANENAPPPPTTEPLTS